MLNAADILFGITHERICGRFFFTSADRVMAMSHGIFINYKRANKHLAGRIYDYFNSKGMSPFMDEYSMRQGDFRNTLEEEIVKAPYFLCLLTADGVKSLTSKNYKDTIYFKEIQTAYNNEKRILLLIYGDINFDSMDIFPPEIESLKYHNYYKIPEESRYFYKVMDDLFANDISEEVLLETLDWRDLSLHKSNVWLTSRAELERSTASLENRFGKRFVDCVKSGETFTGEHCVKEVNMVCYAANIVLCKPINYLDRRAFDYGLMYNIFGHLFDDPNFMFRLVLTAPESFATEDAIVFSKLGNSAFEDNEQLVFLSSFASIEHLKTEDPYKTAFYNKRFTFFVTECALPYSLFQIVYKDEWKGYNHIKIDLYSNDIDTSVDRQSMMIFQKNNPELYAFFEKQIHYFNTRAVRQRSAELISQNRDHWIRLWEENKPK